MLPFFFYAVKHQLKKKSIIESVAVALQKNCVKFEICIAVLLLQWRIRNYSMCECCRRCATHDCLYVNESKTQYTYQIIISRSKTSMSSYLFLLVCICRVWAFASTSHEWSYHTQNRYAECPYKQNSTQCRTATYKSQYAVCCAHIGRSQQQQQPQTDDIRRWHTQLFRFYFTNFMDVSQ